MRVVHAGKESIAMTHASKSVETRRNRAGAQRKAAHQLLREALSAYHRHATAEDRAAAHDRLMERFEELEGRG